MSPQSSKVKEQSQKLDGGKEKRKITALQKTLDRIKNRFKEFESIFPHIHQKAAESGIGAATGKLAADYEALKSEFDVVLSKEVDLSSAESIQLADAKSKTFGRSMSNFFKAVNFKPELILAEKDKVTQKKD